MTPLVAMDATEFGSLVAIVIGYLVCFGLWYFVFRGKGDE
jgi:hypothetical protein